VSWRTGALATALCLAGAGLSAQATPPDQGVLIATRAARAYQELSSFQADFVQHWDDRFVDPPPDSRGKLYQSGPNHFAMLADDPPGEAIVIDGASVYVYSPTTAPDQAMKLPMPTDPVYGANLLATLLSDPAERYRITYQDKVTLDGRPTWVLTFEPVVSDLQFKRAKIWFDTQDLLPRRIETDEIGGARRTLILSHIVRDRPIPPAIFVFKAPSGVRIIAQ
jgi:outer membrane lipoprotein-sorting protein